MMLRWLPLALPLALACSSSASPAPIRATDYDTSCLVATDCVEIVVGDVCGCPGCGGGAINVKDQAKYESDYSSRRASCSTPSGGCPAYACVCSSLACVAHTCAVVSCQYDAGGPGDASVE